MSQAVNSRVHAKRLFIAATLQALLYVVLAVLSRRFEFGTDESARPIILVLIVLALQFALYVFSIREAVKCSESATLLAMVFIAAAGFRLLLLPTPPIQEVDIYRYLWDGAVTASGTSPYRYAPSTVQNTGSSVYAPHGLDSLVRIRDGSPSLRAILYRIHYAELSTIYPPVSQSIFAASQWITPQDATVEQRVSVLKGVLTLFDLGTAGLVWMLLVRVGRHPGWTIAYAWCPLVIKEISNTGHLDSISVFLTTLAAWWIVRTCDSSEYGTAVRLGLLAALTLALAIGAKLYAVVLLPVFAAAVAVRLGIALATGWLGFAAISAIVLIAPMFYATPNEIVEPAAIDISAVASPPEKDGKTADPQSDGQAMVQTNSGLAAFLTRWEMNDFLFMIVVENLRPTATNQQFPSAWFAVVPNAWRRFAVQRVAEAIGADLQTASFMLARTITASVFVVIAFVLASRVYIRQDMGRFLETAFLTLAWFWLLSPTQNPWYWIWAMPFLPFARNRAWYAISGLVMTYYLRFWLDYHYSAAPAAGGAYSGVQFFDFVVTWFEFGLWFLWLGVCWYQQRKQSISSNHSTSQRSVPGFTDPRPGQP